ncbi:MAG: OmpH family outer membrane protein [Pseudomonadota bacterium]|nr:OmpH family outer membrane protein [Pseudomonadota bacterium]MDE3037990.1 OmpH family outer membrane protein [Pseudomonadota bacterium]
MKKLALYSLAAALLLLPATARADGDQIATVNIQQIMKDSTAAQAIREQLDRKQKTFQAEISKKESDLQKQDQDLGKQRSVLSKDAFEKKVSAFRAKVTDAQKEVQSKKALLDNASARAWGEVQKAVTDIVADLAKERNFTVVIASATPTSEILYADSKLDITDEVLKRLNKKLPKFNVTFNEQADKE